MRAWLFDTLRETGIRRAVAGRWGRTLALAGALMASGILRGDAPSVQAAEPAAATVDADAEKEKARAAEEARRKKAAEKAARREKHDREFAALRERIAFYTPPDDAFVEAVRDARFPEDARVRNIIFLIGDGMGPAPVFWAAHNAMGHNGRLHMECLPVFGYARTYSANAHVTDSAAAGTALATGHKTNNGRLGRLPDGTDVPSILEAAQRAGWRTGLISTKDIVDATPAAFASHVDNRYQRDDIAAQMAAIGPEVLMGGGRAFFLPARPTEKDADGKDIPAVDAPGDDLRFGHRKDGRDLTVELKEKGYALPATADELDAAVKAGATRVLALVATRNMLFKDPSEPTLQALTEAALAVLSEKNAERDPATGFFLMVEGAQIDSAGHANDPVDFAFQTLHFDLAVASALRFAAVRDDTLVVVTADHDTGGLGVPASEFGFRPTWSSNQHSALPVPVYAFGPGAARFAGAMDNIEIPRRMAALAGLDLDAAPITAP